MEPVTATFHTESIKNRLSLRIMDSSSRQIAGGTNVYNTLEQINKGQLTCEFKTAGTYYIIVSVFNNNNYTPYLLTMGDGMGIADTTLPGETVPTTPSSTTSTTATPSTTEQPTNATQPLTVETSTPGTQPPTQLPTPPLNEPSGITTVASILQVTLVGNEEQAIGVRINWSPNDNALGYRIFRAETMGAVGSSISDFPILGSEYVDVNLSSHKTYHYYIQPVMVEAVLNPVTVTLTPETLGTPGPVVTIAVPEITTNQDTVRSFILMQIGKSTMLVNEKTVPIDASSDATTPVIYQGRTLVPIRAIIEAMGGTAGYDAVARKVSLAAKGYSVDMWLDVRQIVADGISKEIDVAPTIINDRTMLPLRFVAENMGCEIEWIGSTQQIIIVY